MARPFHFCAFRGVDGSILVTNDDSRVATESDMEWFWRRAEPDLDRLTMEMCAYERGAGIRLEAWQLQAEMDAFQRIRARAV